MAELSVAQRRTLEALADTMLPRGGALEPGAADLDLAGQLEAFSERGGPTARRLLGLMLSAFALSAVASRHLRPFHRLSPRSRLAYLNACERSRLRRGLLVALKSLLLMHYCQDGRVRPLIGYDGQPRKPVEEDPGLHELPVTRPDRFLEESADVVVVGSGAGGAVMAKELAEGGWRVVVLEEGERFDRRDFQGPFAERLSRLYRDGGLTFTLGTPVISLPMGKGVGGSTLINSGTCFRTPPAVLRAWGLDADELGPLFERVEAVIGVAPVPAETRGPNAEVLEAGRARLGLSGGPLRRNARGCHGHGMCAFGCPLDAKQGMHVSYLPLAVAAGARIYTGCRVTRILVEGGQAIGVEGPNLRVRAPRVVLAAGAVHTPDLLLRNRLANSSGQVGRHFRIHPGAGVLAAFDRDLEAWKGVMQSHYVDDRLEQGVLLEATYPPPGVGYSAGALPEVGPPLKDLLAEYRRTAAVGLIVSDSGTGRVWAGPGGPLMLYSLDRRDLRKLLEGIALSVELYLAAGAREVHTLLPGMPPVTRPEQAQEIREGRWKPADFKLSAYHPMGTCRLGSNPRTSVVDQYGQAHDLPGLTIADASILPGSTQVNPQVTIMALATRVAQRLLHK